MTGFYLYTSGETQLWHEIERPVIDYDRDDVVFVSDEAENEPFLEELMADAVVLLSKITKQLDLLIELTQKLQK